MRPFSAKASHEAYTAGWIVVLLAFVSTRSQGNVVKTFFLVATKENWRPSQKFVFQRHWKLYTKIPPYTYCKSPRQTGYLETTQQNRPWLYFSLSQMCTCINFIITTPSIICKFSVCMWPAAQKLAIFTHSSNSLLLFLCYPARVKKQTILKFQLLMMNNLGVTMLLDSWNC